MYANAYNKLFWSLVFIIFNLNLGPINILPSFVGYILIYLALNDLSSQEENYIKCKIPTILLLILSFVDIFYNLDINTSAFIEKSFYEKLISLFLITINILISLYLVFNILSSIYKLCEHRKINELKNNALTSWRFYSISSIIYLIYLPFYLNFLQRSNLIIIILFILNITSSIYLMIIFKRCKIKLSD